MHLIQHCNRIGRADREGQGAQGGSGGSSGSRTKAKGGGGGQSRENGGHGTGGGGSSGAGGESNDADRWRWEPAWFASMRRRGFGAAWWPLAVGAVRAELQRQEPVGGVDNVLAKMRNILLLVPEVPERQCGPPDTIGERGGHAHWQEKGV